MISLLKILKEQVEETKFSGKRVWNQIVTNTPEEDDIPWGFESKIKSKNFKFVDNFDINSLLQTDADFKDYFQSGESRYNDLDSENIENEIVVVDGELLDGYSRVSALLNSKKKYANAFVAI
jgi:hypothetical protein